MQFIDPRIDFAFKKIFGSEDAKDILISFLESLLGLQGEKRLREVTLMDPFLAPRLQGLKSSVLDVRCLDHRGVQYIVEMQVSRVRAFLQRIQFNASKAYVQQIASAEEYPKLNQVIAVTITDFRLFNEFEHCVSMHEMRESLSGESLLREILYYFVELPKFTRSLHDLDTLLDKWIYFIRHASALQEVPERLAEPAICHAFEKARVAGMNREELEYYDKSAMAAQDARGALELAVQEAEKRGEEKGKREGEAALLLRLLQRRFGPLPEEIITIVRVAEPSFVQRCSERLLEVHTLEELFAS
ncbi:Rpn family recombination-promoting nuclease/putative transposase [Candidatus Magnetaquicoccus inordinatus]|uniref:Rpn family recombination-promoting nuclease/putative transposase n=1 Tax=Candidatus Magnetaquicoccus inordinatus TaxID=2496818 RepID=UPI00102CA667|nr:Rpn family recombination-promoting nuclease/putative transposase [Candidatus Magnetaquicoccus inordinatus]